MAKRDIKSVVGRDDLIGPTRPKHAGGRPTMYQRAYHPEAFVIMSRKGKCISEIAADWGTHRQSLYVWAEKHPEFREALKVGKTALEAYYSKKCRAIAGGAKERADRLPPNVTALIWLTKQKLGWSDRVVLVEDDIEGVEFTDSADAKKPEAVEEG